MQSLRSFLAVSTFVLAGALTAHGGDGAPAKKEAGPPNLVLDISAALVNKAVHRSVDRTEPFEDVILERLVEGIGRTQGTVHAELIPDACRAAVDVVVDGTMTSTEVTCLGFLRLHTFTATPFVARHRVTFEGRGIRSYVGPVQAHAVSSLRCVTDRAGDPYAPGTQLAKLGFCMDKEEAEAEASAHTADRLAERMGADLAVELAKAGPAIAGGLGLYRAAGLDPRDLSFNTTSERMQVQLRFAIPGRPRPALPPPAAGDADLVGRVHQSVLNEMARATLGGKTFSPAELLKVGQAALGQLIRAGRLDPKQQDDGLLMEKLLAGLGKQTVAITLATNDPVRVSFTDKGVKVEVHLAELRLAGVAVPGVTVGAIYGLERSGGKVQGLRQGPVTFRSGAGSSASEKKPQQPGATLAPLIQALFAQILPEQLILRDLSMPEPVSGLGVLVALRAEARDGWLMVAWKLPGTSASSAAIVGPNLP
jgi:hypothetical protein